ncbi:hypothetical protein JJB11_20155 [Ramlibacter ginsenosidimutans]|uniref:Uncharacterized protein n=1 Tax=Ramlibacter ginsenosidimutans TaxID=502333 RepID=A0A934TVP9_9BURK|nr:hypothetical protein [Ramlibacter ginsenosidimutans]MBK6008427.1 hypothetical protein [Ramlibacter ginsenosidimutans]
MSDDSDLLIAAAATAAVFTWVGTRASRSRAVRRREWRALAKDIRAGLLRSWRESPGYLFVSGIRELFKRKRK